MSSLNSLPCWRQETSRPCGQVSQIHQSNAEFIRFLTYSRRSTAETQNCAYIALDQKYISNDKFKEIYNQGLKTIQIIGGPFLCLRSAGRRAARRAEPPGVRHGHCPGGGGGERVFVSD